MKHDLVFMLEPLSYALDENVALTSEERRYVVVESARRLAPLCVDVLKVEFPLDIHDPDEAKWAEACEDISFVSVTP